MCDILQGTDGAGLEARGDHLVVDATLLVAGASKVAAAAGDERDGERLAEHRQRALLPEAVDQRHHPPVVSQHLPQRPAQYASHL